MTSPAGNAARQTAAPRTPRELQAWLAAAYPDARPLTERDAARLAQPVATGIPALDRALPGGGFPRGRLTVWAPERGAAAVLRAACRAARARGERAAWVDASGTLTFAWAAPAAAAPTGATGRGPRAAAADASTDAPLVLRPTSRLGALRATRVLLESSAFGLVVLEAPAGDDPLDTEVLRLTRAARAGGGAFVALTPSTRLATLRITSRFVSHGIRRDARPADGSDGGGVVWAADPFGAPAVPQAARVEVWVRATAWHARATLALPVAPFELHRALARGSDRRGTVAGAGADPSFGGGPDGADDAAAGA